MTRQIIETANAPAAVGPYSQAVRHGNLVFLSGQIALDPAVGKLVEGDIAAQTRQVFSNLKAVCEAAGGNLDAILKLNIYLTDLGNFATVNEIMAATFSAPYPARATIGVAALPLGAEVEMEAVLGL
jgi:reactive intermediate/imine deaminase